MSIAINLKKIFPRSLYKRFILIIAVPIILTQLVSLYVFYNNHLDIINKYMSRINAEEINFILSVSKNYKNNKILEDFDNNIGINFEMITNYNCQNQEIYDKSHFIWQHDQYLYLKNEIKFVDKSEICSISYDKNQDEIILVTKNNNDFIKFTIPYKRLIASRSDIFIFWLIFTSSITLIISIIFLKNQLRSLNHLKDVAEKFGKGQDFPDIRPSGSEEIRSLAISFIRMRDRIIRQVSQRTDMLSAVSHDLRTPLTRMKLQLEMMPASEQINELKDDIIDMENLVEEYLEFVRSDEKEKPKKIIIKDFLEKDIVKFYAKISGNVDFNIKIDDKLKVSIKQIALKRALINLLDNAIRYGDKVELSANNSHDNLIINIDDNGPGIPAKDRSKVLKPFYRGDNARNLDKNLSTNYKSSGSGLGLSIVNDIVLSHGGRIKLAKSHLGGLKVTIYIPL